MIKFSPRYKIQTKKLFEKKDSECIGLVYFSLASSNNKNILYWKKTNKCSRKDTFMKLSYKWYITALPTPVASILESLLLTLNYKLSKTLFSFYVLGPPKSANQELKSYTTCNLQFVLQIMPCYLLILASMQTSSLAALPTWFIRNNLVFFGSHQVLLSSELDQTASTKLLDLRSYSYNYNTSRYFITITLFC